MTEKDLNYVIGVLKGEEAEPPSDWFVVLGFLQSHRIEGLFYNRAKKQGIILPKKAEKLLSETFMRQKRRVEFVRGYIRELSQAMSENGADYIFLKGSVLSNLSEENSVYQDGERISNDIDLLVKPDGIGAAEKALQVLGYQQGEYEKESGKIRAYTRLEIVKRRMNRGEAAPFIKLTGDPEIPFVEADINFSLGNTPGAGLPLLEAMLQTSQKYCGHVRMQVPNDEMFFMHLIMHQYKESELYFTVERGKDLDLYKLADIYYLYKGEKFEREKLYKISEEFETKKEVGAVLWQVGEVFSDEKLRKYAENFGTEQPKVLDYEGKKQYKWATGIRKRITTFDTRKYLKEEAGK